LCKKNVVEKDKKYNKWDKENGTDSDKFEKYFFHSWQLPLAVTLYFKMRKK